MVKSEKDAYDVIIIGAGIGGLVCGCYLAKAGMKVLIVEQHFKPGGYCTSFKRKGYTFDAAPHCFGSYRNGGIAQKIFQDLGLDKMLTIMRPDPSDTIITPNYNISFWNDLAKTTYEFQASFPKEKENIKRFFDLLIDTDPRSFSGMRSRTFKQLVDEYFMDDKLKAILSIPFLGIGGLPASMMSAFVGAKLYSEFLFDGGYYPHGGMQAIPDALTQRFKEAGGEMRLSTLATKIKLKDNAVIGIVVNNNQFIPSKCVVSDCDARQTFLKLLGKGKLDSEFHDMLKKMIPSISTFILYLGIQHSDDLPKQGTTFSFFSHYDIERAYQALNKGDLAGYGGYMLRTSHDRATMIAMMPAKYKNKAYWIRNKHHFTEKFIGMIQKNSIPDFSKYILFKDAATPHTLSRYTLNYKGASFGWASIPSQLTIPSLRKPSFIQGLYLCGHWTTLGIGVSGAAYVGKDTAKIILRKNKKIFP